MTSSRHELQVNEARADEDKAHRVNNHETTTLASWN